MHSDKDGEEVVDADYKFLPYVCPYVFMPYEEGQDELQTRLVIGKHGKPINFQMTEKQRMVIRLAYGSDPDFDKPPIRTKHEIIRLTGVSFPYVSNILDGRYRVHDVENRINEPVRFMPKPSDPLIFEFKNELNCLLKFTLTKSQYEIFELAYGQEPNFDKPYLIPTYEIIRVTERTKSCVKNVLKKTIKYGQNTTRQMYYT